MSALVLRFSAPLQSWAEYRVDFRVTGTSHAPTKTGVAGLLAACLGVTDYLTMLGMFDLWVRGDRVNPFDTDYQVSSKLKPHEQHPAERGFKVATGSNGKWGSGHGARTADRDFLPHSEFMVAVEASELFVTELSNAVRNPVFMPYLGRHAFAPEFPFHMGSTGLSGREILEQVPVRRDRGRSDGLVPLHHVDGNRGVNDVSTEHIVVPVVETLDQQLGWVKENLNR